MQIRRAQNQDLPVIQSLMEEMYATAAVSHALPANAAERTLARSLAPTGGVQLWLLEDKGQPLGYGISAQSWLNEYGPVLYLDELYLREASRGQGYGQAYFAFIEQYAAEQGFCALTLYVAPTNSAAARLYRRLGYQDLPYQSMVKEIAAAK